MGICTRMLCSLVPRFWLSVTKRLKQKLEGRHKSKPPNSSKQYQPYSLTNRDIPAQVLMAWGGESGMLLDNKATSICRAASVIRVVSLVANWSPNCYQSCFCSRRLACIAQEWPWEYLSRPLPTLETIPFAHTNSWA